MKQRILFISLLVVILYCGCKDDAELYRLPYYRLTTEKPVTKDVGVMLIASIEGTSPDVIIERGFVVVRNFVWDAYSKETTTETYPISLEGEFQMLLDTELDPELECGVYAYIKTANQNYKGEIINFKSGTSRSPVIHSVTPGNGYSHGKLVIKGETFSKFRDRNKVYLIDANGNEVECYVNTASDTELTVFFGGLGRLGYHKLKVKTLGAEEVVVDKAYYVDGPEIVSVTPKKAFTGEIVTIEMKNLRDEQKIAISIGGSSSLIIERSNNLIKCLTPNVEDTEVANIEMSYLEPGADSEWWIYVPEHWILSPTILSVEIARFWSPMQSASPSSGESSSVAGDKIIFVDNEAYGMYGDLYKYDKEKKLWRTISSMPEQIIMVHMLCGKGDYIYIAGWNYIGDIFSYYKYHIPSGQWTACANQPPAQLRGTIFDGVWINGEYYIVVSFQYRTCLLKYSPATDTWVVLKDNMGDLVRFIPVGNKIYVLSDRKLYEYDINLLQQGNLVYELPSYARMEEPDVVVFMGGKVYFQTYKHFSWDDRIFFIFCFDPVSKTLKSLGAPANFEGYNCILPFNEGLYIETNRKIHKYIGDY